MRAAPRLGRRFIRLERIHRRRDGWNATPSIGPAHRVQRLVGSGGGATFELQYEITREPVVLPTRRAGLRP
jgi:hypothetical protein